MNTYNEDKMCETYSSEIERMQKCIEELQQENKKLKMINEEYERLNKENYRGFKIINVQKYDIHELLSYKNNWNKLKEDLINDINYWQEQEKEWIKLGFIKFGGEANNKIIFKKILNKMQELEGDNNQ